VHLGAFHGLDDGFYVERYVPEVWRQAGGVAYPGSTPDRLLTPDAELPFPDARLFCFEGVL